MPKSHPSINKGKKFSGLMKARLSVSQKYKLSFVDNPRLREMVKRDYAFAEYCRKQGMFKPAIILYGSIMEALLRNILNSKEELDFWVLIRNAEENKLITPEIAARLTVAKFFRNYVHIYAELEGDIEISSNEAEFFSKVCSSLVGYLEINKKIEGH
jgi:uncharacterized protein YutE (UPF0331/DUF86 family)